MSKSKKFRIPDNWGKIKIAAEIYSRISVQEELAGKVEPLFSDDGYMYLEPGIYTAKYELPDGNIIKKKYNVTIMGTVNIEN